jgi:drug/metabolite transporter (DMT)-like permease
MNQSEHRYGSEWLAYGGLTLTALFWAGNAVVARGVVGDIPPLALSFWRWMIALAIVAPVGLPRVMQQRSVIRERWGSMAILAGLSVGAFNTLLYLAAQTTTAVNIALINSTMPVVVTLLARIILGQRVVPVQALGIGVALSGMLVIVGQGSWQTFAGLSFQPGDLIMVAAVSCWGLFSVLLRRQAVPLDPLAFLTVQIAFGLVVILPFYLLDLAVHGGFAMRPALAAPFLYVAVFPGILAYSFWNAGVRRVGPARSAMFIYLLPVFAAALAWAFLGERLVAFHAVGGALILAGLYLATRAATRARQTAPAKTAGARSATDERG